MIYDDIEYNKNMTLVLFAGFIVFIIILGSIFGEITGFGFLGTIFAFIIAIIFALGSYYYSDKIVLKLSNAREVQKKEFPYLYNVIDELAIAAGLPSPKKYVVEDTALNAFSTGRDPEHSVIVVTTGLIKFLNRQELEGVIAHELSHIKNYDIRLQTMTVVLVGVVTLISDLILRSFLWGDNRRDMGKTGLVLIVIGLILAILSPIIATIIKLAISRQREFLADSTGAMLTRYPEGLASALEKISKDKKVLEAANHATAHLYIANPFKKKSWFTNMFATHPPIEERIARLRKR